MAMPKARFEPCSGGCGSSVIGLRRSIMLVDVTDLEGAYRRYAAERVAAALKQAYEPLLAQDLPPQHADLLEALRRTEAAAEEKRGGR